MRYSVYVSGRMPLAYYSPAENDRVLQLFSARKALPRTIALPEMTGFYNTDSNLFNFTQTIALPEMTGFYNPILSGSQYFRTIALPETAGL